MKWLNNINIRGKLTILSLPLSLALIFSVIYMGVELSRTEQEVTSVYYDTLYTVNSNLLNADRDLHQALVASMQYYDFKNGYTGAPPEFAVTMLDGNLADYKENCQQVYERVAKAMEVAKGNEDLYVKTKNDEGQSMEALYADFTSKMKIWEDTYDLQANTGDWEAWHGNFSNARAAIDHMQELTETWAGNAHDSLVTRNRTKITVLAIVYGVLIVFLAFLVVFIMGQIRKGLQRVTGNINELAKGDLTLQYPNDNEIGRDDIGRITKSTKMLTEKLSEVITRSLNMSRELTNTSSELAESSSQATQASGQVTLAVEEISKGAVAQADSVDNAVNNTDAIGSDIDVIIGAVNNMDKDAEEMIEACNNSMASLDDLIRQNEEVTIYVKEIGGAINSTNTSAKSISQFTEAITDIASRTNLLSLNASIEAARAGEAGKGFAVVADEIRQLADQSNESAGEIRAIVEQLLADASSSVAVLDKLNNSFSIQEEQLNSTRQNMQIMSGNVESVKGTSQDISQRVGGLSSAKDSLAGIIADLAALSEENAASTEETNASMEELNATFTLISESASKLRQLAEELAEAISYFEVELQEAAL